MHTKLAMSIQPFHLHLLLLRVLLVLFIFTQFSVLSSCCHDHERNALLHFKSELYSDPENRLSSWQVGENCCNWHGIRCSNDSGSLHVVALDLGNTKLEHYLCEEAGGNFIRDMKYRFIDYSPRPVTALEGTISSSLFNLTHLEYLDLSFNDFQFSKIPQQFANLKKLTHLDLSYSEFEGSITTQFANLSSLRYLDLSGSLNSGDIVYTGYNDLQASTNWLGGLVDLQVLKLSAVDLSSSKNWAKPISHLVHLRELDLSYCDISGSFPVSEFLNLSRLSTLKMSGNNELESFSIPIQLANLTSLSVLDLSWCGLQGQIPYLPQLKELQVNSNPDLKVDLSTMFEREWPKLRTLSIRSYGSCRTDASFCSIRGSLPTSMFNHSQLRYLDLSYNEITGHFPSSIFSNHSQLEYLYLDDNNITGHFPSSFSNLKNLKVLLLKRNNLQGSIPESLLCEMSSLQELHLTGNNLTGPIPSCISNLPNLPLNFEMKSLFLSSCNLEGNIPSFICKLTHLEILDLSNNTLKGAIPSCLFQIQTLVNLDLSLNNLQGTLSQSLQQTLNIFNLSNNHLQGPLPVPQGIVFVFDVSRNNFSGEIPIETGERFSNTTYLSLSFNRLSGSIPSSLCSSIRGHLANLNQWQDDIFINDQYFDLSNNQLSGTIPSSLGYCVHLRFLNLGMNKLVGNVPNELRHATNLQYLQLSDNTLNGSLPSFIWQLENLQILNLQNNGFEGNIPTFIGSLLSLQILSLRSNKFNGSLPKEIMNLQFLQILDLSRNNFSGPIPRNIGNLSMLRHIYDDQIGEYGFFRGSAQLQMMIKGNMLNFQRLYKYNTAIDLSCNNLEGNIPEDMDLLQGLPVLNLSHNHLSGKILSSVGNMSSLQSLDLSFNNFFGKIPYSLTSIDNLGYLNLSFNNLSGRIPTGPHFQTLSVDDSAFIGNPLLCGPPTIKPCEGDHISNGSIDDDDDDEDDDPMLKWVFYGVVALGYGVGFWGLFFVLLLRRKKWWFGYWRVVDRVAARMLRCVSK